MTAGGIFLKAGWVCGGGLGLGGRGVCKTVFFIKWVNALSMLIMKVISADPYRVSPNAVTKLNDG